MGIGVSLTAGNNRKIIQACRFNELVEIAKRTPGENHFYQSILPWQVKGLVEIWIPQIGIYQKNPVSFNRQGLGEMDAETVDAYMHHIKRTAATEFIEPGEIIFISKKFSICIKHI